jgi:hypothetical protein
MNGVKVAARIIAIPSNRVRRGLFMEVVPSTVDVQNVTQSDVAASAALMRRFWSTTKARRVVVPPLPPMPVQRQPVPDSPPPS